MVNVLRKGRREETEEEAVGPWRQNWRDAATSPESQETPRPPDAGRDAASPQSLQGFLLTP